MQHLHVGSRYSVFVQAVLYVTIEFSVELLQFADTMVEVIRFLARLGTGRLGKLEFALEVLERQVAEISLAQHHP